MSRPIPTRRLFSRKAFTLTEIVVTMLLIAVALALSIPQFSSGANGGTDGLAQTTADGAVSAEMGFYRDAGAFTASTATLTGSSSAPGLNSDISYVSGGAVSTGTSVVSVAVDTTNQIVGVAVLGGNSTCWFERRSASPSSSATDAPTIYGMAGPNNSSPPTPSVGCAGTSALAMVSSYTGSSTGAGSSWANPLVLG